MPRLLLLLTRPWTALLGGILLLVSGEAEAQAPGGLPPVDTLRQRLARPHLPDTARVRCYWMLARQLKNENMDSARHYAAVGAGLARRISDVAGEAHAERWLGNIHYQVGNYPAAQRSFERGLRAARRAHRPALEAWHQLGMGLVAEGTGNVAGALEYFAQAQATDARAGAARDEWFEPILLTSVGIAHLHTGKPGPAARAFRTGLALARQAKVQKPGEMLNLLDLVGLVQQEQHHPDSAVITWKQELALARQHQLMRFETFALGNLASGLLAQDHPAEALGYARQAVALARKSGNQLQLSDFTLVLANILHALGRPEAFDTLKQFNALNDTIMSQSRTKAVAQAQARFDVAGKQARIRALEQQRRIAALEADRQEGRTRFLTLALIGLGLMLTGGSFFYERLRRSRTALAASEAEARAANATKDQLMSIIGHDLRGPVATVRQLLPMVLPTEAEAPLLDAATRQQATGLITSGVYELEALLDNLLQWGRTQGGQLVAQPQPVPAELVLRQATGPYEAAAVLKGIHLSIAAPTALCTWADLDLLRTVLRNLVNNAVKFTPPGGHVWVAAEKEDGLAASLPRVRFSVRDTGRGLSAEQAAAWLTDASGSAPSTAGTAGETGTGLGLALSARLVRLLGGELRLVPPAAGGGGAHFAFSLPGV